MGFDEVGMSRVQVGGTVRAHEGFGVRQLAQGDIRVTSTTDGVHPRVMRVGRAL